MSSFLDEMNKHLLRVAHSIHVKTQILESIKSKEDGEIGLLTLDWAQKFLPQKHNETQKDYFGKRGLSYHVSHIQLKHDGVFKYHYFVHIMKNTDQGQDSVIAILYDICERLEGHVKNIIVRSDNASCYKNAKLIRAIPKISAVTSTKIMRYSFTESQFGKGPSDRGASIVKRHAKAWLNSKHDIATEDDLFDSIVGLDGSTPKSMSVILCNSVTKRAQTAVKSLDGIKQLHDFDYISHDEIIVTRRYANIGGGLMIYNKSNDGNVSTLSIEKTHVPDEMFTEIIPRKKSSQDETSQIDEAGPINEEENEETMMNAYYQCNVCQKLFVRKKNYLYHMNSGNHQIRPEHECLQDVATRAYATALETYNSFSAKIANQLIEESKDDENDQDENSVREEGWALPKKKTYTRFSEKQKSFMTRIFEQGEATGVKQNGRNVEKSMPHERDGQNRLLFKPDECLSYTQIQGFFNRLSKQKNDSKKAKTTHQQHQPSQQTDQETMEMDNEEEEDEELDEIVNNDNDEALDDITIDELRKDYPTLFDDE